MASYGDGAHSLGPRGDGSHSLGLHGDGSCCLGPRGDESQTTHKLLKQLGMGSCTGALLYSSVTSALFAIDVGCLLASGTDQHL